MNIKAIFPAGASELIVHGLHQWDYGRKLEIHSDDLPALIEVHFACAGMTEAVVRSCNVVQGVAEAVIPDQCLEQTTPIVAWVYAVGESSGATIKTITLTVIQRARPQPAGPVPTVLSDRYTELVAAVNEQVAALKAGSVTVARALTADKATEATKAATADKATEATKATTANSANSASSAAYAALSGLVTVDQPTKNSDLATGLYVVKWRDATTTVHTDLVLVDATSSGNIYGTGAEVNESGPYYSAYSKCIAISTGCEIVSLWKIGVYIESAG